MPGCPESGWDPYRLPLQGDEGVLTAGLPPRPTVALSGLAVPWLPVLTKPQSLACSPSDPLSSGLPSASAAQILYPHGPICLLVLNSASRLLGMQDSPGNQALRAPSLRPQFQAACPIAAWYGRE